MTFLIKVKIMIKENQIVRQNTAPDNHVLGHFTLEFRSAMIKSNKSSALSAFNTEKMLQTTYYINIRILKIKLTNLTIYPLYKQKDQQVTT